MSIRFPQLLRFLPELGGTRLRVASVFVGMYDSTGPAPGECRSRRAVFRDYTQESRPLAMI